MAQTEFQNADTGDEKRFFSTLLKEVALQKRVADSSWKQLYQWTGPAQDESQMEWSRECAMLAKSLGFSLAPNMWMKMAFNCRNQEAE